MKFYLYKKANSTGCDYNIACGQELVLLSAKSMESAIEEVRNFPDLSMKIDYLSDIFRESGAFYVSDDNEYSLSKCTILAVSEIKDMIPVLEKDLKTILESIQSSAKKTKEDKEKLLFEKLKKKYG